MDRSEHWDAKTIADAADELRALEAEIDELGPTATAYAYRRSAYRLWEQLSRIADRDLPTGARDDR